MAYQFRIAPGIEQWAARLTAPLHDAWRGRPGREARQTLGKIGYWVAQPGLEAACQRQLVALQRSRRDVADVATAVRRLELRIAELERQATEPRKPGAQAPDVSQSGSPGQGDIIEQIAGLRRQHADLQAKQERVTATSNRLMAEINALRAGKEAIKAAYAAAEEAAKTVSHS